MSEASHGCAPSHFSFLCDPRGQLLGAQEESLLSRLFEARERNDLQQFGGHFPTDPELLRPIAYPHRPGPRSDFLRRLIAKLVQVRVATLIPPEPCQAFDLPPYLSVRNVMPEANSEQPARVIHISSQPSGPGPPKTNEVCAVAAAAASVSDFIARAGAAGFYPGFDLAVEWNDYVDHRRGLKKPRPTTLVNFVQSWMANAQRRFGKLTSAKSKQLLSPLNSQLSTATAQPELDFAERPDPRFVAEFEARKMRRAG